MTEICEKLPFEIANIVYSYLGEHPVAKLIKENEETLRNQNEFCDDCNLYTAKKNDFWKNIYICSKTKEGLCEFCYGENELGIEVFSCVECGEKTYEWTDFNNTEEDGLFCRNCYDEYFLERLEEEEVELD